jgi:hypothetical protein
MKVNKTFRFSPKFFDETETSILFRFFGNFGSKFFSLETLYYVSQIENSFDHIFEKKLGISKSKKKKTRHIYIRHIIFKRFEPMTIVFQLYLCLFSINLFLISQE